MFGFLRTALVGAICLWTVLAVVSGSRAANYDVVNPNDSGAGTLRRALDSLAADGDTITFNLGSHGPHFIGLNSGLPDITVDTGFTGPHHGVLIEANSHGTYTLLSAGDGVTLSGLDAILKITAEGDAPTAIEGIGALTVSGDISGEVTAMGGTQVYGIFGKDSVTLAGGVSGTVSARGRDTATAIRAVNALRINNGISGTITAAATQTVANGIYADQVHISEGIAGRVSSQADAFAYGIRTCGDAIIQGGVSGTVSGSATTNDGYGLIAGAGDIAISKGISGIISGTAGSHEAYGLYSGGGTISISGGIAGRVESQAGGFNSFGLNGRNGVSVTGGISGTISAFAADEAYGVSTNADLSIRGGISGEILAKTSTGSNAFGLQSGDNLTIAGDMSGKIDARAGSPGTGTKAYGVSAGGALDIERISGTVTAISGTDFAYSLHSDADLRIARGISGTISAQAGGQSTHGLYTDNNLDIFGGITGNILARAGTERAITLYGDQVSVSGDISGIISARGRDTATAIRAVNTLRINNGISGTITAAATQTVANGIRADQVHISEGIAGRVSSQADAFAYGIRTCGDTIIQGGVSGTVSGSATTNDGYGLIAGAGDIAISNGISGIISGTAGSHEAYGLYSGGGTISISGGIAGRVESQAGGVNSIGLNGRNGVTVTDGISGTIIASAGGQVALGLAASHGRINGGAPDTALDISGTVSARARGLAVAVSAGEGMTIGVSDVLNGMDQTGGGEGYAIRSGRTDGAGGWVDTEAVDIVTLFNGANLGGKIDLSGGNDTLTFEGEAGTDSLISGGSGTDTLGLSGTGTARFSADITDFERLVKSGSGRWILPGNLDIPGTIVNGGTLEVQGNLVSSDTQIGPGGAVIVNGVLTCPTTTLNRGGTLGGGGSIRGNLVNQGTIAPGNSPGTLTIQGNYVHGPGSTLAMEITPATSDRLVVTGTADLQGGTMALAFAPGYYQAGTRYPLLSAGGGINGAFSEVTDNSAFLDIGLSRDNDVLGCVVTRRPYEDAAASQNARQAGMVLTAAAADPSAAMQRIISVLDFLPAALVSQGLDQLHPEPFDALSQVAFSTMGMFAGTTRDRLFALRTGRAKQLSELNDNQISRLPLLAASGDLSAVGPLGLNRHGKGAATPFGLYIKPLGRFETYENSGNRTGYTARTFGVAAGGDMGICHKGILGLQLGYARSDLDFVNTSQARSDHFLASLYGSYFDQGFYADAVIQAGGSSNTMERRISFGGLDQNAESGFTALNWSSGLKLGYDFPVNKKVRIGPVGSLDYAFVSNPMVVESGASGLNLKINSNTAESLKSALGLIASAEFDLAGKMVLTPDFSVKWGHEFLNSSRLIGAVLEGWPNTGFTARTGNPSRDSMLVGAGLTLRVKDRSMVFARYTGELLAGDRQAHGAAAGFRYEF